MIHVPLKTSSKYFIPIISVLLALLAAMPPFAIDTYLSAMPEMAAFFGVGINMIEITLTVFYLGFALGHFVGGPLSDSFGRKKIALIGILLYSVSAISIAFAVRIEIVWLLRAGQAFGGGFASVTTMLFVRDWFQGKKQAKLATIISMIMMLAPLFAPVLGGVFLKLGDWQMIFYFLSFISIVLFVLFLIVIPESRDAKLLTKQLTSQQLLGNYKLFFRNKQAVLMLLAISLSTSGMFTFLTGSSFMYIEYYGFSATIFPLLFGANIVLNIILSILNTILLKTKEPEEILKIGMYLQLFAGIVLLVVTQFSEPTFGVVFSAIMLFVGILGMITGNGTVAMLNILPHISGSANATIGVFSFVLSFIAGSIPALFYTGNLIPIGIVMFTCTLLANVFFKYSKSISLTINK